MLRKSITDVALDHSIEEHAISIGIKTILFRDGMFVSAPNIFFSAKRADQHQQRRLRQMEICEHRPDHLEIESGVNKYVGDAGPRKDRACSSPGRMFESSNSSGADGNDATFVIHSPVDRGGRVPRNGIRLGVNFVIFHPLHANGLERSQTNMQSDFNGLNSAPADAVEDFRGEMKSGSRSGDRTTRRGIDSLIALPILARVFPCDVGRKWNVADAIKNRREILDRLKADAALPEFRAA